MPNQRSLNDKDLKTIRKLRDGGMSFRQIARRFEVDARTVRRALDKPDAPVRKYTVKPHYTDWHRLQLNRQAEESWREQVGSIPRAETLNQALLGDPFPGRSALDRRQNA